MKKLLLLLLCVPLMFSCGENKKELTEEEKRITEVLTSQQECWNNGDIDGFMKGYWNSEELIFTSLNHQPTYGWQATLERYKNSYPTKESMGDFRFEIYDIELTSKKTAILNGKWELIRINDHPQGNQSIYRL